MQINLDLLQSLFDGTKGRVKYKLGAKVPLGSTVSQIVRIDCSGFVIDDNWGQKTYVALGTAGDLYRITDGILKAWMPEDAEPF